SWDLHCRTENTVVPYAWRPPSEELPVPIKLCAAFSRPSLTRGARRCPESCARPRPLSTCLDGWRDHPYVWPVRNVGPTRLGSFARCHALSLQGGIEARDQGFAVEGLGQVTG